MFPQADIPVVQLSLDQTKEPAFHYALGQRLQGLRKKGVLILGSGNVVHNLGEVKWQDSAYDWAIAFDQQVKASILDKDHDALIHYDKFGKPAQLSIPTNELFLPLLYVLALQQPNDTVSFFTEKVTLGAISMRSVKIG
jgi:4,5-DOPA dioxygenase extradiol